MVGQILFFAIIPGDYDGFSAQAEDCYARILSTCKEYEKDGFLVAKATFFVAATSNEDFVTKREQIFSHTINQQWPALSVVAQTPYEKEVAVELFLIQAANYSTKALNGNSYLLINGNGDKVLISQGLHASDCYNTSIYDQSVQVFECMKNILLAEGMNFNDIVRQWNYIENITKIEGQHQNYQVFNDVRSHYYNTCQYPKGYPAATGIGTQFGGITVDFIAITSDTASIIPIKSPIQTDAHKYSENVLAQNNEGQIQHKTTPKFERAKYVGNGSNASILISGTAAIKGETTEYLGDFIKQTELTLQNIIALYSRDNLERFNTRFRDFQPEFYRFYVKNHSHLALLKAYIDALDIDCNYLIVQSDICRDNLLVEIEGIVISS